MDIIKLKTRITERIGKYKYAWIVLLVGMVLMMIPGKDRQTTQIETKQTEIVTEESSIESQLEEVLRKIDGAGDVKVMLGVELGERIV